jgi:hypothetical protein
VRPAIRPRTLDPVLIAHLVVCPPCRDVDALLAAVPALREVDPPSSVWAGIVGEVHRRRPVEWRRHRLRRSALRRPRR